MVDVKLKDLFFLTCVKLSSLVAWEYNLQKISDSIPFNSRFVLDSSHKKIFLLIILKFQITSPASRAAQMQPFFWPESFTGEFKCLKCQQMSFKGASHNTLYFT